ECVGGGLRTPVRQELGRGLALRGTVWPGGDAVPAADWLVVVAADGTVAMMGPAGRLDLPGDLPVLGGSGCWVGPGVVDCHVHLAFGGPELALPAGVLAVRDLGAPRELALRWRMGHRRPAAGMPRVAVAGRIVTAPGGYPSQTWGAGGFAAFAGSAQSAAAVVREMAADGVDLIKIALEPGDGWPVLRPSVVRAVVDTAH